MSQQILASQELLRFLCAFVPKSMLAVLLSKASLKEEQVQDRVS